MRLLIIDHDRDDLQSFANVIDKLDVSVKAFYAANQAEMMMKLATQPLVDLIFIDFHLPAPGSMQLLKDLKYDKRLSHIPVVVYSVAYNQQEIDTAFENGAQLFFVKPYASQNFMETMKKVLNIDLTSPPSTPSKERFVIDLTFG